MGLQNKQMSHRTQLPTKTRRLSVSVQWQYIYGGIGNPAQLHNRFASISISDCADLSGYRRRRQAISSAEMWPRSPQFLDKLSQPSCLTATAL